jgi:hypothetical protein
MVNIRTNFGPTKFIVGSFYDSIIILITTNITKNIAITTHGIHSGENTHAHDQVI